MANVRVLHVMQGQSGLPEDRYVNTWHFSTLTTYAATVADALIVVQTLYETDTGIGGMLGEYISPVVDRVTELRAYNLADDEPRVPTVSTFELPAAVSANGLPEECAAVLSFHGDPPVTARRRGRIYVGPLVRDVVQPGDNTDFSHFTTGFQGVMVISAGTALDQSQTSGAGWAIRSTRPAENFVPVVGGWFDNAIDIQRRRGAAASIRSTWDETDAVP